MAKQKQNNPSGQTSLSTTNSFNKGMMKDMSESFMPEGSWYHARNLITNSIQGDLGAVGNEPSNIECITLTYTFIGAIPVIDDYWVIFSTDDSMSEVGLFKEQSCEYYIISRDAQWNFNRADIIIGVAKENFDCSYQLYWADGVNPDRTLNIGDIRLGSYPDVLANSPWPGVPYVCIDTIPGPCENCEPILPLTLDVERTRLAALMKIPCIGIQKGFSGGQLLNGSYYATIAYSVNQQRVTDYFNPSPVQPLFSHENAQGALDINFSNLDTDNFNEFQLVVVATVNQQTVAKIIGYYNTQTNAVSLDFINPELESVPIQYIPLRSPAYEKSEAMYAVNNYMIRTAPTGKFDFNYQPLANQIETNWVLTEYPADYYEKGGNQTGYMRDEQYCFWIRWVYNTGDRSSSYHIPGRVAAPWEHNTFGVGSPDNIEFQLDNNNTPETWEVVNTAYATTPIGLLPAASAPLIPGLVIAKGKMGYWESTESYPADKPDVWNATQYVWAGTTNPDHNLCGLPIRHHKMPSDFMYSDGSNAVNPVAGLNYSHVRVNNIIGGGVAQPVAIRLLGVEFENIKAPVDNDGNIIPGIVGYEILRSNRQGNRTIIAKGAINNMRYYYEDTGDDFVGVGAKQILYPNYVGNYLGQDFTITSYNGPSEDLKNQNSYLLNGVKRDYFTFHSPDTNFEKPFLSAIELKIYGELGHAYNMRGLFEPVPGHPKEKLITNFSFLLATVLATGYAAKAVRGETVRRYNVGGGFNAGVNAPVPIGLVSLGTSGSARIAGGVAYDAAFSSIANIFASLTTGVDAGLTTIFIPAINAIDATLIPPGVGGFGSGQEFDFTYSEWSHLTPTLRIAMGLPTFAYYWTTSIDAIVELIKAVIPYREYVYRSLNNLNLTNMTAGNARIGNTRRLIKDSTYLDSQFTVLGNLEVNNLYRPQCVGLQIGNTGFSDPLLPDRSVQTICSVVQGSSAGVSSGALNFGITFRRPNKGHFRTTTSCYYGALKVRYRNQYGQIESPKQIPTGCVFNVLPGGEPITDAYVNNTNPAGNVSLVVIPRTPVILGGDVYIGRYTEKNTFFYFYDWLYNVVDGTEFDYTLKYMINYPRFYADFTKYDSSEFFQGIGGALLSLDFGQLGQGLPGNRFNLDGDPGISFAGIDIGFTVSLRLGVANKYMYLFQSGIRDFFVESEYNVDLRDWGELKEERIFDPYGYADINQMFDTDIIKFGNYYKYDISLGLSKVYNSYISWGNMQDRSYNPEVSENCYTYFPNRVIYSLPQNEEDKKDYWRVFLVNNYNDFNDRVIAFKSINKNGAIILFQNTTPLLFNAVDQLQTVAGTKITIGDGGLFSQPLQTLNNADVEFQHGSCQDRLSVINTPAGIYWMSASQGKIFTVANGMMPISDTGMKWWFSKYLKFFLLEQFPDFDIVENPVFGIGCQSLYDNDNGILYFCKKDYRLKPEYLPGSSYIGDGEFSIRNGAVSVKVPFRDPQYFEDVSWTVSFDTKSKAWVSFHDWHPEYALSSIKGFNTTQTNGVSSTVWKHGNFTSSFCRFYGVDYPFTIDYVSSTGQTVNTTRSVEYLLESYVYDIDGIDRFQILDYNFDEAVIYNTEQTSGLLRLNPTPKNNAPLIVNYPIVNFSSIDILYSKEEQKIRFNQFWDITNNRGEFFAGVLVQQPIWNTELNGYIRVLNPANLNYAKPAFERKKFRHYLNHLVLTKNVSNNVKMLLKVINNKLLNSPR